MRQRALMAVLAVAGMAGAMMMTAAGPATATAARPASARVTPAASGWGSAKVLPGTGALGSANPTGVSCRSTGNCTAAGNYNVGQIDQGFVISKRNGHWGKAEEIPGLGALNSRGNAEIAGVSCGSAGNCVVAGTYEGSNGIQGFAAVQKGWHWSKAASLRGLASLNADGDAEVRSVSCASAGNCVVGGSYLDSNSVIRAFVVSLSKGHWARAIQVPGTGNLNVGGAAQTIAVSCPQAGDCSATGYYRPATTKTTVFVVGEKNGHWRDAIRMPGIHTLNAGGSAFPDVLSCSSAGNCAAGGDYKDANGHSQAYLETQRSGHWKNATEARGTGALNTGGGAEVTAVDCTSSGNCTAGGHYNNGTRSQLFLSTESKGTWGKAAALPGISSHNKGSTSQFYTVACASSGNCAGGGYYENSSFKEIAFVITKSGGHWYSLKKVPGIGTLSAGDSGVNQLSCPAKGHCTGVGYGSTSTHAGLAFYTSRS
jgi:hypothetical protein